jgi:hypothetical protein
MRGTARPFSRGALAHVDEERPGRGGCPCAVAGRAVVSTAAPHRIVLRTNAIRLSVTPPGFAPRDWLGPAAPPRSPGD